MLPPLTPADMADDDHGQLAIVCIAMASYKHAGYDELPNTGQLLEDVACELSATRSDFILDSTIAQLPSELATALPPDSLNGDRLIVVWSGHGVVSPANKLLLVAHDTDQPTLNATYEPAALAELAAMTGAKQILIVFDTCYSGAGVLPALAQVSLVKDASMSDGVWVGLLAAAQSYGKASEGALLGRLKKLLSSGPETPAQRTVWGPFNEWIRGDELLRTVEAEWESDTHQRVRTLTSGLGRDLILNPCREAAKCHDLVAHLRMAARGADPGEDAWYFSGRDGPLREIVGRIDKRRPGLVIVTGPAGSGKSAILGRVAALSDQRERRRMEEHGAIEPGCADPGIGSVDANLNLRNLTSESMIQQLGRQLNRPGVQTIWALMDAAEQHRHRPVIVLDGLDEAGAGARRIAREISRLAQVCCVFVATRRLEAGADVSASAQSLPHLLSGWSSSLIIDLADDDPDSLRDDLVSYAEKRLTATFDDARLDQVVAEVARIAMEDAQGGAFLLARVLSSRIRDDPDVDPDQLTTSLEQAFEDDLRRWPEITRDGEPVPGGARDLLFALAFAAGAGLPARDVWPVVATALSDGPSTYTEADVGNLIGTHGESYGRYIVADREHGQAVYRLYHRRLVDHLRGTSTIGDERAVKVYRALESLASRQAALR